LWDFGEAEMLFEAVKKSGLIYMMDWRTLFLKWFS
jgi:hypothetical protein